MKSFNKYLAYVSSLALILLINLWYIQKNEAKRFGNCGPSVTALSSEPIQTTYMTINFVSGQVLDLPLVDQTYFRNGKEVKAKSETITPRGILSIFGRNGWEPSFVSNEGLFLLKKSNSAPDTPDVLSDSDQNTSEIDESSGRGTFTDETNNQ